MNMRKLRAVVRSYRILSAFNQTVSCEFNSGNHYNVRNDLKLNKPNQEWRQHCIWMLDEMTKWLDAYYDATLSSLNDENITPDNIYYDLAQKCMRWLCFIQGLLWLNGYASIDELRDDNMDILKPVKTTNTDISNPEPKPLTTDSANSVQVGGDHYRKNEGEQHWDRLVRLFGLPQARCYFIGNITAYVERYQSKNGIEDLEKARHYITKLIEEEKKFNNAK